MASTEVSYTPKENSVHLYVCEIRKSVPSSVGIQFSLYCLPHKNCVPKNEKFLNFWTGLIYQYRSEWVLKNYGVEPIQNYHIS
jgi:hypothetical protein